MNPFSSCYGEPAINDGGIGPVNYPLIADTTKQMSQDYDVVHEESGFSARGTYLIDPDGNLLTLIEER